MPFRIAARTTRADGPTPFSSAWIDDPNPTVVRRRAPALPGWIPGDRVLTATLVLLLATVTGLAAIGGDGAERLAAPAATSGAGLPNRAAALPPTPAAGAAVDPEATGVAPTATAATGAPVQASSPPAVPAVAFGAPRTAPVVPAADGALLPAYRILTYYGHPHDENMGIVGEHEMEELRDLLLAEAANYEAADPSRPVLPAFELIATVAQPVPGDDGTYILDTDLETLAEYVDFAEANDLLVVLDLQIGRGTVATEIEKVRPLLERPNVHLALDPEFAIAEGEVPGEYIGELEAESITYAQETLAALSEEKGLPPKVLIVHQFREDMIVGKEKLAPVPGVQLVIEADGFGAPELKTDVYNILVRDEPVEFAGVKLFYKQDKPLMTAAEILALQPPPDVVIYQ
jgi:hypothetical protein